MVDSPSDAGSEDRKGPATPERESKGRRRLVIPDAAEHEQFIATLSPGERAEFLSHHYKLQQVEQLTTRETQAFRGCAWRGGFYCGGFTLAVVSGQLVGPSRRISGAPDWVHWIVAVIGVIGGLLCIAFVFPAIIGFFRWVFAMRDRRRLGRVMVMPAASFEPGKAGEGGRDRDGGASA